MHTFFKELFEYNHHFNQELAGILASDARSATPDIVRLFSHILNAQQIWNSRIRQMQSRVDVWQVHAAEAFHKIDTLNYRETCSLIDQGDMERAIEYTTSKGQVFRNSARDIFFHILNHSTYHRGQIAMLFRREGIDPPATDYIFYKRL